MERVVLKQSYKPKNVKSTPRLNVAHFRYICTRPGAVHNPNCGFSLFGKLPGYFNSVKNLNSYDNTKELIREVSNTKTIYRTIISVGDDTAKELDLYNRENFQRIVEQNMWLIKNEHFGKDLKMTDFGWVGAFHYKKGHPHIHIMYWNNSDEPQQEGMSNEKFQVFTDKVKKKLVETMYSDEFADIRSKLKEYNYLAPREIQKIMHEEQYGILNYERVENCIKGTFIKDFMKLAQYAPTNYDFSYDTLPKAFQKELNGFIDKLFNNVKDFWDIRNGMRDTVEKINELKMNSPEEAEQELKRLEYRLYKATAEPIVEAMKNYINELKGNVPYDETDLAKTLTDEAEKVIAKSPEVAHFVKLLPKNRVPMKELFENEKTKKDFDKAVDSVVKHIFVQAKLTAYIDYNRSSKVVKAIHETKEMLKQIKEAEKQGNQLIPFDKTAEHMSLDELKKHLNELLVSLYQDLKTPGDGKAKELRSEAYKLVSKLVWEHAVEGKEWPNEAAVDNLMNGLLRAFASLTNEQQSQNDKYKLLREHYRELSESALKDLKKRRSISSDWDAEM